MRRLSWLPLVWLALVGATPAPLPLTPPPPDLSRLVPFVQAPLDKPAVTIPDVALPAPPATIPTIPPARLALPTADRPVAPLPPPRTLPCIGTFLRVASESLECGRARFGKGEFDDAARSLEAAIRASSQREITIEARYWLGETLVRLGQVEQADWMFRQAVTERPTLEHEVWAVASGAWTALAVGDATRARDALARLLAGAVPPAITTWGRHGLGLAHYALGQYADADRVWAELERRGVPPAIARDVQFWRGETLGRLGNHAAAIAHLSRFTQGGQHPLLGTGWLRLGWWSLTGGRAADSIAAFRTYAATARPGAAPGGERTWGDVGVALALASNGDWVGARNALANLMTANSPLAVPVALTLVQQAVDARRGEDAEAIAQTTLAGNITPPVRAWLLLMKGDAQRIAGNRDDARTQYELAEQTQASGDLGAHARFRLARVNYELREYAQAVSDVAAVLRGQAPPEIRAATLLLQAEAAYRAGDLAAADAAFRRVVVEMPQHPEAAIARLSLAWVAMRQGKSAEARQLFAGFARAHPEHPGMTDALLIASELQLASGDLDGARRELDRIVSAHATHPRADFARLNRAIVALRTGQPADAQRILRDWIARVPFPPLLGRAHLALGAALLGVSPAEASKHFAAAHAEGAGPVASLGLGAVALQRGRADEATRSFTEARDTGTAETTAAAEYGLAAAAALGGPLTAFKAPAATALHAAPTSPMAPRLLYLLTGIAVEEKDWKAALDSSRRLVTEFPADERADDALVRVGAGAAQGRAWPVAHEALALLRARYPRSPFVDASRLDFAEALLATGQTAEARQTLEPLASAARAEPRVWMLLGKVREATGDRSGAMEAYARAAREGTGAEFTREALLGHARLLTAEKRWDQARAVLEHLLRSNDQALALEAAIAIGETYRGEGEHVAAAEYFMTAAYLAPDSPVGRRALVEAGQSLAAAKHADAAAAAYRKLLAQSDVPAELADAARQGLQAISR